MASLAFATPQTSAAPSVEARLVTTLTNPLVLATRVGENKNVYIAQRNGIVKKLTVLASGGVNVGATNVIDLTDRVLGQGEQGLLGLAFSADGTKLYAYWTGQDGNNGVYEYAFANGLADKNSQRTVISFSHPGQTNHNGGNIAFGPDGFLWIATGDGRGGGDPNNNAQNLASPLGKMLRINPAQNGTQPYTVPADNPFLNTPGARPEIIHLGLRNPWRWSFDRQGGKTLWIADVGQNAYEEVNRVPTTKRGANFGWDKREGTQPYEGGAKPPGNVDPIFQYNHDFGCSITGGYVYRGKAIAELQGTYIYGDFCEGSILGRKGTVDSDLGIDVAQLASFGQDARGELWMLSLGGNVYRLVPAAV